MMRQISCGWSRQFQRGVPKEPLQQEGITTRPDEHQFEGVPERVRGTCSSTSPTFASTHVSRTPETRRLIAGPTAVVGAAILVRFLLTALAAPWVSPADPTLLNLDARLSPPGTEGHLLGSRSTARLASRTAATAQLVWRSRASPGGTDPRSRSNRRASRSISCRAAARPPAACAAFTTYSLRTSSYGSISSSRPARPRHLA
ncbi:MAG: hypothetical protein H0U69_13800 [Trueperaceae bacterium]|nr:hypothetical protein [Trueperaceae bacterium]